MKKAEFRGIQNFWQQEDPEETKETIVVNTSFTGKFWAIHVNTPVKESLIKDAKSQIGQCIFELLKDPQKTFETELNRLYIYTHKPATSKVTFDLGACTLYAQASSTDPTLALERAIDRLAQAMSIMETHPNGKHIVQQYGITVRRVNL
jgi:hypothetical protein